MEEKPIDSIYDEANKKLVQHQRGVNRVKQRVDSWKVIYQCDQNLEALQERHHIDVCNDECNEPRKMNVSRKWNLH